MKKNAFLLSLTILFTGCNSASFWDNYEDLKLTQVPVEVNKKNDYKELPKAVIPIRHANGEQTSEVSIPLIGDQQIVVIEHDKSADTTSLKPNNYFDKELVKEYKGEVASEAAEVNLSQEHARIKAFMKKEEWENALNSITKVLARYPEFALFLRLKGTCLYKMQANDLALEAWTLAQQIEPTESVQTIINQLQAGK